jgi:hypothetical protein
MRRYASVTLIETSTNLAIALLRAGLARVKPQGGGRAESEDVRELTAAEGSCPANCSCTSPNITAITTLNRLQFPSLLTAAYSGGARRTPRRVGYLQWRKRHARARRQGAKPNIPTIFSLYFVQPPSAIDTEALYHAYEHA